MRIFDSHIHADALSERIAPPGAEEYRALVPGITPRGATLALESALDHECFGAAVHPWHLDEAADIGAVESLLAHPLVCAVGETGLDHLKHESDAQRALAERWFADHIRLALEHDLPLVIHSVRAHERTLSVLRDVGRRRARGVIHAFSGSAEIAAEYWREGFYVGIGAAVTRERSKRVRRAAAAVPLERILVETDAPFMATNDGTRGQGTATDILDVVRAVASLRGLSPDEVAQATFTSATALFDRGPK